MPWPVTVIQAKAVRLVVQPTTNIWSLFGCSARLNRLSEEQCHDFSIPTPARSACAFGAVGHWAKLSARLDSANLAVHSHNPSCLLAVKGGSSVFDSLPHPG